MMTNNKKYKTAFIGRLMVLPLIAVLTGVFSFKGKPLSIFSPKTVRVVIDAGHGGDFVGAQVNGALEKNINLEIAKKIKSLSPEYNVEVIMTRESDQTPGSKDLKKSLEYIAALPKNENADLFISIHSNLLNENQGQSQTDKSGFQIFIPPNSNQMYQRSLRFGSVISSAIKSDYTIEPQLKQTADNGSHILILNRATVPSILIECGYMDNPSDLKYLLDEKNEEKIARDILEGIRKYAMQKSYTYSTQMKNSPDIILPADTLTYEAMNKLDVNDIKAVNVDRKNNLITIAEKNGKVFVVVITEELKRKMDLTQNSTAETDIGIDRNKVFTKVEVEAEYPGGYAAWCEYLSKNLKYPDEAVQKEIKGMVITEFIVKSNGDLTNIHIISGPKELREASMNVIKGSGKWTPAKQKGIAVDSYHRQPIVYKLEPQN